MEKVYWNDVRDQLLELNPALVAILDELSPSQEFYFYKVSYPYGAKILRKGAFYFPYNGRMTALTDPRVPQEIREDLDYNLNSNPAGIQLTHMSELFVELNETVFSATLLKPGAVFGFSPRLLQAEIPLSSSERPISVWDMTAGARSVVIVPKITDSVNHAKLKREFGLESDVPQSLQDQWLVFREIAAKAKSTWRMEVLFFNKRWIQHLQDVACRGFKIYCLESEARMQAFWTNSFTWNLIFAGIQARLNVKKNPIVMQAIQQVFAMATGAVPGYRFSDSDAFFPKTLLERVYRDIYELKDYYPLFLNTDYFDRAPVYCSMEFPPFEIVRKEIGGPSFIMELDDIAYALKKHLAELEKSELNLESAALHALVESVTFKCFHPSPERSEDILPTEDLLMLDPVGHAMNHGERPFPKNAPFFKSAIGVFPKG